MPARNKFIIGSVIIVAALAALAYTGFTQSKTYYHTISELSGLQGAAAHQRIRVAGNVRTGSINRLPGRVDFVLEEQGRALNVSYAGRDPLPDTFKDNAQALVEGKLMPDGRFVAEQVQAKCASKYQATPQLTNPGAAPSSPKSGPPSGPMTGGSAAANPMSGS
jgi:cytochrome c-type biogenesis protein CcmE